MDSEENTVPNGEQILRAILELRGEVSEKIDSLRGEMNEKIDNLHGEINARFEQADNRFEEMRLQMMSFDVRIDRIEALTHEVLNVAYNARADVKVLREEVRAWAKDVSDLQLRVA